MTTATVRRNCRTSPRAEAPVFRDGYSLDDLRHDAIAGITVAIVALALAIASERRPIAV